MRKYQPLRPRLYAAEVQRLIDLPHEDAIRIDLHGEAKRIAQQTGLSNEAALRDLVKAGVLSKFGAKNPKAGDTSW